MRTTLTLDNDLAMHVKLLAHAERRSVKDLINDAIRRGIGMGGKPLTAPKRFRVQPKAAGFAPGVDPLKLNQLVDELESERFTATPSRGSRRP